MRFLLHTLLLLTCLAVEYGFIHGLAVPWSLIPLCLAIGVFFVFTLHVDLGLFWFVGVGFVSDLQSMHPVGETLIGALVGGLLIYVVQQHISHSSLYSVMILGGGVSFVWLMSSQVLRLLFGSSATFEFGMILEEVLFAMLLSAVLLLIIPRVQKRVSRTIRLQP